MTKAFGFGLFGQWGPLTDHGEVVFSQRVKAIGVDIGKSPYRDYEVNTIVQEMSALPADATIFVWGSSLGANNAPVVAAYAPHRTIHGMFGFQASEYGAKVPIRANVKFAHEFYNPVWLETIGLGHYEWTLAPGNHVTRLVLTPQEVGHPGESQEAQNVFLAEMKRIMVEREQAIKARDH